MKQPSQSPTPEALAFQAKLVEKIGATTAIQITGAGDSIKAIGREVQEVVRLAKRRGYRVEIMNPYTVIVFCSSTSAD